MPPAPREMLARAVVRCGGIAALSARGTLFIGAAEKTRVNKLRKFGNKLHKVGERLREGGRLLLQTAVSFMPRQGE